LTIASPIDERADLSALARSRDEARLFRRAMRHSRRVRFLRWAIPLSILGGVGVGLLATEFNPLHMFPALPVDFSGLVVSGTKITMQAPRIAGFTADQRPYEVTARAAAQDVTNPDTIELQGIHGKGEMGDRSVFVLTADSGLYDSKTEMMTLRQNVILKSSSGFEVYLNEATIDVHKSNVVSEKPVQVKLQQGTIDANRMEVVDSGKEIRFGGGVTMVMSSGSQPMQLGSKLGVP
jgi:lipopolysaccharide export system protein LptC